MRATRTVVRHLILIGALSLAWPGTGHAQEATLSGTVTDSTGAVLPGVTVVAVHEATGNNFEAVTDERGTYRLPVRTGSYRIAADLAGFATLTRPGVNLLVGQTVVLNLQLSPSAVQETVTVTGEAPLIDTTASSLGANIDPRQMQDLPINGRNWFDLSLLAPGSRANSVGESPTNLVGQYNINVDGQEVTMKITATNGQPGYSRDAIGEFEILTNRFDATQGRSSGIMINAITKSGTNTPSGSFSGYFRDDRFNAADHVIGEVLPYSNRQLSGTFGGPLRRDRIHFFANYEYEREPSTVAYTTPYPSFNVRLANTRVEHKAGARFDFQFSSATRMTVRTQKWNYVLPYNAGNTSTAHPSTAPEATRKSDQLLISLTQVLSNRAVNEFKVSYAGFVYANTPHVVWPNHPKLAVMGLTIGAPSIQLTGFAVGSGTTHPQRHPEPDYNIKDDFTFSYTARGRHDLRFGGEYMYIPWLQFSCRFCAGQLDARGGPVPANIEAILPVWDDVSTWNLAALSSISRRYIIGVGDFRTHPHRQYFAGYVQDDWAMTSRLTLNLGVRYDLILGANAEKVEIRPFLEAGRSPDNNNFGPRVGFAYSLNDRTVARGGFGVYFGDIQRSVSGVTESWAQQLLTEAVNDGRPDFAANPFNGPWPQTYAEVLPRVCTTRNVPGCLVRDLGANMTYRDAQFPYSYQSSIGVQRQLGTTMAVEADYVYNGGRNEQYDRNQNLTYNPATGVNYPFSDVSRRSFPEWGQVATVFRDGRSNYHSLQTAFTKRFSNRWQAAGNYLLAVKRDGTPVPRSWSLDADGFAISQPLTFPVAPDLGGEYGLATGDQRHRVVVNGIFEIGYGVQASGMYFFGSGERRGTSYGGDRRVVGVAGEARLRLDNTIVPRNNFVGAPIHRVDLRLQRRFPLGGRAGIDGMVEVFNLFNHANFGSYSTVESSPTTYGRPEQNTNVAYQPRMMQFGFRLSF